MDRQLNEADARKRVDAWMARWKLNREVVGKVYWELIEDVMEGHAVQRERAALEQACKAVEHAREWARQYLSVGHKWEQATDYIRGMDKAEEYIRALLDPDDAEVTPCAG